MHQVRNTLEYVSDKDKKAFANDLKTIYHVPNEEVGYERCIVAKAEKPKYGYSCLSYNIARIFRHVKGGLLENCNSPIALNLR